VSGPPTGAVASPYHASRRRAAQILTPLADRTITEITNTPRTWQYAPYRSDGAPHGACFPLTFSVR
jgi:hypothetical protein